MLVSRTAKSVGLWDLGTVGIFRHCAFGSYFVFVWKLVSYHAYISNINLWVVLTSMDLYLKHGFQHPASIFRFPSTLIKLAISIMTCICLVIYIHIFAHTHLSCLSLFG